MRHKKLQTSTATKISKLMHLKQIKSASNRNQLEGIFQCMQPTIKPRIKFNHFSDPVIRMMLDFDSASMYKDKIVVCLPQLT